MARLFSETLSKLISARRGSHLFPGGRGLKIDYKVAIDNAVYHGGVFGISEAGGRYEVTLKFNDGTNLPFMAWTAGQREFTPLLLGLSHLFPVHPATKVAGIDWVVIEEPEMGLHPQALTAVLLLVMELPVAEIRRWIWISSGKDTVSRGSTEWRKLIKARIELVGRHLPLP